MFYNKQSFTLIELLIVVSVISILATLVFTNTQLAMIRSKIAASQVVISGCVQAIEAYRVDLNGIPPSRYYCLAFGEEVAKKYFELPYELTSPVAYLHQRPLDPFYTFPGASEEDRGQTIKYRHPGFGYFNNMPNEEGIWVSTNFPGDNGDYIYYNNASETHPADQSPVEYGFWSVGPVPKTEIGLHMLEPVPNHTWYEPTNGTISSGIIVRLNTGHHAP